MYIYFFIWISIVIANAIDQYKTYLSKFLFFNFILFIVFFVGLRYQIGGDWYSYQNMYDLFYNTNFFDALFIAEPGYSVLNIISQSFHVKDVIFVNFMCAVVLCFFLYKCFIKLKKYWLCMLLYYPYHILGVSLGYTRQSVAVAILLYAFTFLFDNKKYSFVALVILASMFHRTAILMLLFYPISFLNKKMILVLYQIATLIFISLVLYFFSISESSIYTSDDVITSSGVYLRLSLHIIPICTYLYFRKKLFLTNKNYKFLDYFFILIFYCICLSFVFSTLVDRFNLYLVFFDIYVIVLIFSNLNYINRKFFILILSLFFTVFICVWLMNSTFVRVAWTPYQNYLINYLFHSVF